MMRASSMARALLAALETANSMAALAFLVLLGTVGGSE